PARRAAVFNLALVAVLAAAFVGAFIGAFAFVAAVFFAAGRLRVDALAAPGPELRDVFALFAAMVTSSSLLNGCCARGRSLLNGLRRPSSSLARPAPIAAGLLDDLAHRIRHEITRIATGGDQFAQFGGRDLELSHRVYVNASRTRLVQIVDAPRAAIHQQLAERS